MRSIKAAAVVAALCLFSGSVLAAKDVNAYCTGQRGAQFFQGQLDVERYGAQAKYCEKSGGDAFLAAEAADKLNKKLRRLCERYNKKLERADCATNGDPDIALPIPADCAAVASYTAADFTVIDPVCNGIADP